MHTNTSSAVTDYLYELSLDSSWVDEEVGSVDEIGWYGFISFDSEVALKVQELAGEARGRVAYFENEFDDNLGYRVEKLIVTGYYGACIEVNSQGFKSVELYEALDEWTEQVEKITSTYNKYFAEDAD